MEEVAAKIAEAHELLKSKAVEAIQNNQDVDQRVLDAIKAVYALRQALEQAQ